MRRAPSIVALLLAAATCSVLGVLVALELRAATPDTTPRAAVAEAAAERADARDRRHAAKDRTYAVAFDPDMVRETLAWRQDGTGPRTTDVVAVNATPGADLAVTARACARATAREHRTAAQCYAFASTEAYEHKNLTAKVDYDGTFPIVALCWAVLAGADASGTPTRLSDMRDVPATWSAHGCPESWTGTTRKDGDDA